LELEKINFFDLGTSGTKSYQLREVNPDILLPMRILNRRIDDQAIKLAGMATNEFRFGIKPTIPAHWRLTASHDGFEIEIAADWIEARIKDDGEPEAQRGIIEPFVHGIARTIGLAEKKRFTATISSLSRVDAGSNRRDSTAFLSGIAVGTATGHAEMEIRSSDGGIITDTRQERISGMLLFADSSSKDQTLTRMSDYLLEYYSDPGKRLAPLFDIIELAEKSFGGRERAANALGISNRQMKSATGVMNNKEICSSRHRGQALGNQRDPQPEEMRLCEAMAEKIVTEYAKIAGQFVPKSK
jgi:hypothetical protein